jgi:hypothetical protein
LLIYTEECVDRKEARRREKYWKRGKWQKKIEITKVKIHVSGSTCLPRHAGRPAFQGTQASFHSGITQTLYYKRVFLILTYVVKPL